MGIAEVLMATSRLEPRDAALAFAQAGTPVFPCAIGGKRPLTQAGFHDASCDADQVRAWWARWPEANIGMPTGGLSGIDVVDIDVTDADSGFAAFERATAAGLVEGDLARVRTPSGGLHVYFPAVPARPQRCWQAAAAHIDFRGNGGYVIAPPSTLATNNGRVAYRLSLSASAGRPVDAVALRGFVDPRTARTGSRPAATASPEPSRLARWVSGLHEGERNRGPLLGGLPPSRGRLRTRSRRGGAGPGGEVRRTPRVGDHRDDRSAHRQAAVRPFWFGGSDLVPRPSPINRAGDAPCLQ